MGEESKAQVFFDRIVYSLKTLSLAALWFALSYCALQLGFFIAAVVNGNVAVVTL